MITLSIDVTLLDKNRFKLVTRKNGKDAKFCELVLIETPNGQYGDYLVKQSVTKEERAAKLEMPILGNGKNLATRTPPAAAPRPAAENPPAPAADASPLEPDNDVPF